MLLGPPAGRSGESLGDSLGMVSWGRTWGWMPVLNVNFTPWRGPLSSWSMSWFTCLGKSHTREVQRSLFRPWVSWPGRQLRGFLLSLGNWALQGGRTWGQKKRTKIPAVEDLRGWTGVPKVECDEGKNENIGWDRGQPFNDRDDDANNLKWLTHFVLIPGLMAPKFVLLSLHSIAFSIENNIRRK